MKVKIGRFCMVLGLALIFGALLLHTHNRTQADRAAQAAADIMPQLVELVQQGREEPTEPSEAPGELPEIPPRPTEYQPEDPEMTEVVIDGDAYIGFLAIPSLHLELPVLADWNYDLLQKAPCRYVGSTKTDNLVLMAHNYDMHFGRLSSLSVGDMVYFTDMDGEVIAYTVMARDVLHPTAIEEMTSGEFDLTLFTCTYGGSSRVTVYCDRYAGE